MENEEVVIVFSEHRVFGWKFTAYTANTGQDGCRTILGVPDAGQEAEKGALLELVQAIKFSDDMSDKVLIKDFSRQKSLLDFLKSVPKETQERYIRPRIELLNRKIAAVAVQGGIPVYLRLDLSSKRLYETDRISFFPSPAKCVFNFIKDKEGFRYFIELTGEGRHISLRARTGAILSDKPCIVLIGSTIYNVEEIEAKKLTPFFTKASIPVAAQMEETYLRDFAVKTIQAYETNLQGIPFREITPAKQAFLSLERDFNKKMTLILSFGYGESPRIYPDNPCHRLAGLEDAGGATGIWWNQRDREWEEEQINRLLGGGLVRKGANHFHAANDMPYELIEWVNLNENLLRAFAFEANLEQAYYTGSVSLLPVVEMKVDWFEINVTITIGQFTLPLLAFRKHILSGKKEYAMPDGSIFILPEEWFEKYQDVLLFCETDKGKKDVLRLKKIHTSLLDHALRGKMGDEKQQQIDNILQIPAERPELPRPTAALLRPYQKEGFYWMHHLYKHNFGGCLADDMGLGKTLQAITLLQFIYKRLPGGGKPSLPPSLVVVPTSLLHNWRNELARFAPELNCLLYAGNERAKDARGIRVFRLYEVVITSYGTMRNDIELLGGYTFQLVVLDESQYVKNPESLTYKAAMKLNARRRLALTGTPLENSLEDLWAQFNFINKGLLGSLDSFRDTFVQPVLKGNETQAALLKRTINPFLLRRTKEEVTPDLPPLIEEVVYCDMPDAQMEAYNSEKNRIRNLILEAKDSSGLPLNSIMALEALSRLRQLANHPAMVLPGYTDDSGKFEQIILAFESLKESGHKALFFSSYVKYLKLIAKRFDEEGWKYAMLTGETRKREEEIKRFTNSKDIHCFFISLKAGSTGLNLTAADYVFILDPWWNPAAEMQALSRAHRIGQDKPVMAFRFISTDTIEEKIMQLQKSKSALFETFINANNPLEHFTWDDLEKLVSN